MTKFTEDSLLRHAQFICDQVSSFDDSAGAEDVLLITTPCMRALANLAGVVPGKKSAIRRMQRHNQMIKKPAWTKATTTKLVKDTFENIFTDQLAKHDNDIVLVRIVIIYILIYILIFYIENKKIIFIFTSVLKDSAVVSVRIVNNLIVVLVLHVKIC